MGYVTEEQWAVVEARLEESLSAVEEANRRPNREREPYRRVARWELTKLRECLEELDLPNETS
jgi:hypothetical protein